MALLSIQQLTKCFGPIRAVSDLSLEVERGEFFGLLGPSGCGKTTVLRMIAGLETPDQGRIDFDGKDVSGLPPESRGFGFVFQNYALFPHLNVQDNVAFGLRARKIPKEEIARRVSRALEMVQLPGFERRPVSEISGGQQQRVALARAISIEPALLLLDEPLSNLDSALREETRKELRDLVTRLGLTAIYVTHDQDDAFELCDRIAVMDEGRILQTGSPRELYERPEHVAVARFLGRNNLILAMRLSSKKAEQGVFKTLDGGHLLCLPVERSGLGPLNKPCVLAIRPEHVHLTPGECSPNESSNCFNGVVRDVRFTGSTTAVRVEAAGLSLEAVVLETNGMRIGDGCCVSVRPENVRVLG
jgi:ABC-type Fe3+/spermidine/putrescine transport system ATPase subunit